MTHLGLDNEVERMQKCGTSLRMACDACNNVVGLTFRCELKICPECMEKRKSKLIREWTEFVRTFDKARFVTLTVRNIKVLKKEHMDKLAKDFNYFINKALKRKNIHIKRGFRVFEVKEGRNKDFNLHLHALFDGPYIPVQLLSQLWYQTTKTSYIVDIRLIRHTTQSVHYMTKYLCKVPTFNDPTSYAIYLKASKNKRIIQAFGKRFKRKKIKTYMYCPCCKLSTSWNITMKSVSEQSEPIFSTRDFLEELSKKRKIDADYCLDKIADILDEKNNGLEISERIGEEWLSKLLEAGYLYHAGDDTYKLL